MAEEKKIPKPKIQNLMLENREKLSVSGVLDVLSFNDEIVIADTELGELEVRGVDLRISKLNLDSSELTIYGDVQSCVYTDRDSSKSKGLGFFSKIFK